MKLKQTVYNTISSPENPSVASRLFDALIIALILVNMVTVVVETFKTPPWVSTVMWDIELVSIVVFIIEYLLRVWVADLMYPEMKPMRARLKYIRSFMAMIDLIAILPYLIPFNLRILRTLRLGRLFRILKLNRYTSAMSTIGEVFKRKKRQLLSSVAMVGVLMVIASVMMYHIENQAQPDVFENALSALWWAFATLTTVGYGDMIPVTTMGKILSAVIALLGIGLVAVPAGILSSGFVESLEEKKEEKKETKKESKKETETETNAETESETEEHTKQCFCPYCGKKLR